MPSPELKISLQRLLAGGVRPADRDIVRAALLSGDLVYASGDRNVSIGGDGQGAIIVTGDQAQVKIEVSEIAIREMNEELFPAPNGIAPPFPDLVFIGRENALGDVRALVGVDGQKRERIPTTVVRGWPGVGKTTLVGVLARDPAVTEVYTDGVLWASLDQAPDLISVFATWGRSLGRGNLLHLATIDEIVRGVATLLRDKRMLLIVDDVWSAEHGALFQRARGTGCALLFTTREPQVAEALAATDDAIYTLPILSSDDALKLLRVLAPGVVGSHPDECRELVDDLECLPLALHVAGRLLRAEEKLGWGVVDLLDSIRAGAAVIAAAAPMDRMENGTIPTVAALLKKSTDRLAPRIRDCFAYLCQFASKPAEFNLEAMAAVWGVEDAKPIARELSGRGLLEPVGDGRFQMHALLVAHARSLFPS